MAEKSRCIRRPERQAAESGTYLDASAQWLVQRPEDSVDNGTCEDRRYGISVAANLVVFADSGSRRPIGCEPLKDSNFVSSQSSVPPNSRIQQVCLLWEAPPLAAYS